MNNEYTVAVDLTFLRHVADCIAKQQEIPSLSSELKETWLLQTKATIKQINQIIEEKEVELHSCNGLGDEDALDEDNTLYNDSEFSWVELDIDDDIDD